MMEQEHEAAGALLARLRELTRGYVAPPDGCPTFHALLDGLKELERDTHSHIHKENNLLFPAAVALEARDR
jgi:regulator of cell morphogenesis and NO signaling